MNKYDWALVGSQSNTEEPLNEDQITSMLDVAFLPEKTFQLFLCGAVIDRFGTLEEMEDGLDLIIEQSEDYGLGDYCIISKHDIGNLLFIPLKIENDK